MSISGIFVYQFRPTILSELNRTISSSDENSIRRTKKFKRYTKATGFPRSAMARRSVCVTGDVRKSQETRSKTRPLSTFPYVQNAPIVAQARLRSVRARRHNCGAPAPAIIKLKLKLKLNLTEIRVKGKRLMSVKH